MKKAVLSLLLAVGLIPAQDPVPGLTVARIFDRHLGLVEKDLVSLVEAMPADKLDFAPTQGEFKGARTFAQQAKHVAAIMYSISAQILGEKNLSETGKDENGPDAIRTKAQIVAYLKGAFAYGHKALGTLTAESMTLAVAPQMAKGGAAMVPIWHSWDHYGQMVVYARMNGIVPPASRPAK